MRFPVHGTKLALGRAYAGAERATTWSENVMDSEGSANASRDRIRKDQCSQRGWRTAMIIRSELVNRHLRTAESAATAREPRCFNSAKPRRCSAQIPVRLTASSSVKNFWLDLIRTTTLPLGFSDASLSLTAA